MADSLSATLVIVTDVLVPFVFLTAWLALRAARREGPGDVATAAVLLVALAWGALWTWHPTLAAMRLLPPPGGQGPVILALLAALTSLLLLPTVRAYWKTADISALTMLGPWRVLYGVIILTIGALGGLPPTFALAAGIGDVLVGLWAVSMLPRRRSLSSGELAAWNIAGILDFVDVLAVGTSQLRPFFLANPDLSPLNLLPLAGVPVLFALHIMSLYGLAARRRVVTTASVGT